MKDIKNIVIFGTGAVAAEITSQLEDSSWGEEAGIKIKGYVASDAAGLQHWKEYKYQSPYLGDFLSYEIKAGDYFVLALGNYKVKRQVVCEIKRRGGKFITLIHPTAIVAQTALIGEGNILDPFTIVGPNVKLGDFNLLTSQSVISRDCVVGDYNFFATSLLCGYNVVGDDNYFGIRGTTLPDISIGNRNVIQAGMIVDKNVEDDSTIFYRYKEKLLAIPDKK